MIQNDHNAAFELMLNAKSRNQETAISNEDRQWLESHLSECPPCSEQSDAISFAMQELRNDFITASPQLVRGTQLRVRARAWELRQQQNNLRPLWISCLLAFAWAVVSMPFLWQGFEWLGRTERLPEMVWQTGFVIMSLMPIAAVGTIALANGLKGKFQRRAL